MRAWLKHCSPKAVLNISDVSAPFLPSFTQNVMHMRCSCSSDIPHGTNNSKAQVHDSLRPKSTERHAGTIPCPMERGSSRTPLCKQGCPEEYPQPSKKSVSEHFDHTLYTWKFQTACAAFAEFVEFHSKPKAGLEWNWYVPNPNLSSFPKEERLVYTDVLFWCVYEENLDFRWSRIGWIL